jgi:predicted phosphodiesterase
MRRRLNRVAVIGDVHACDQRLDLLLTHLDEQELDMVACVGDLVDGPGDADAAAALLRSRDVTVVRGNHDRWVLEGVLRDLPDAHALDQLAPETVRYLRDLPASVDVKLADGTRLVLCHGVVDAGSLLEESPTCAVIVDGASGTITPIGIGRSGVYPGAPECRFETA